MDADRAHRTQADEQRFRVLFESGYPALRRYASHRGLAGADADDLVAEVLTIAWRRLEVVPTDDPTPWLFAVARNVWRNQLRSAARRDALVRRLPDRQLIYPIDASDALTIEDIRRAMAAMGDDDREILQLVAWDELTPTQAAAVLGCTATAARVRLHRARTRFARQLAVLETQRVEPTDPCRERGSEQVPDEQHHAS